MSDEEKNVVCPCCGMKITEREAKAAGLYKDVNGRWYEPSDRFFERTGQND